jgi:hypothetical protein
MRFVALVMALSEVVDLPNSSEEETSIPRISRDPDDDRVIACAVFGEADVIVSGDNPCIVAMTCPGMCHSIRAHHPLAPGEHSGLGAVGQVELAQDVADIALDRLFAEHKPFRNLGVGQALGDEAQNL